MNKNRRTIFILLTGFSILAALYVMQLVNVGKYVFTWMGWESRGYADFIFNRTFRLLINDALCFTMICLIFKEAEYRQFALWVFIIELFIILPLYLFFKLTFEGDSEISSPLLSFIHRLIVNPLLMILTLMALGYQKYLVSNNDHDS